MTLPPRLRRAVDNAYLAGGIFLIVTAFALEIALGVLRERKARKRWDR